MTQLFAQPYSIDANGFYFTSIEEYDAKASNNRDRYGGEVEEYEIQFIDGDPIDCELAEAFQICQANITDYFDRCEQWSDNEKIRYIIAVNECGFEHTDDPDSLDLDIYEMNSLRELAEQFVDEGLFGEIPEKLTNYLDYDAIAYDLGMDYSQTSIAGTSYVYRSG